MPTEDGRTLDTNQLLLTNLLERERRRLAAELECSFDDSQAFALTIPVPPSTIERLVNRSRVTELDCSEHRLLRMQARLGNRVFLHPHDPEYAAACEDHADEQVRRAQVQAQRQHAIVESWIASVCSRAAFVDVLQPGSVTATILGASAVGWERATPKMRVCGRFREGTPPPDVVMFHFELAEALRDTVARYAW